MKLLSRFSLHVSLMMSLSLAPLLVQAQFCERKETPANAVSNQNTPRHIPDKAVESFVENENIWSSTLDEAAIKALNESYTVAHKQKGIEFGGCLFADSKESPSRFYYTIPVTNNSQDGIRVSCQTPAFAKFFMGLYHTHPIDLSIDGFSAHDIEIAEALNVTSYVGSMYSKNILRFQSCKTKKSCLNDGGLRCYKKDFSRGEVIGSMKGQ